MNRVTPVAMVRCRLDDNRNNSQLRYVAAAEFDLWRHLMESKHERSVAVEQTSVWVPETAGLWDEAMDTSVLEPVVRMCFDKPGPQGTTVPVVRFFPTETYPEAKSALLAHFDVRCRWTVDVTPGYFISTPSPGAGDDGEGLEIPGALTGNPDQELLLVS